MSATKDALIAKLTIKKWSGTKSEKEMSNNLATEKGAEKGTLRISKTLFQPDLLAGVNYCARQLRAVHLVHSRYWDDSGSRLVPANKIKNHRDATKRWLDAYEQQARIFIGKGKLELIKHEAQRRLGAELYREEDYPSEENLRTMFGAKVEYFPVPDGAFIPIHLEDRDAYVKQIERSVEERLTEGNQRMFFELRKALLNLRSSVERVKNDGNHGAFYQSSVDSLLELSAAMSELNITNDPFLDKAIAAIQTDFNSLTRGTLLSSPDGAAGVLNRVDAILSDIPQS